MKKITHITVAVQFDDGSATRMDMNQGEVVIDWDRWSGYCITIDQFRNMTRLVVPPPSPIAIEDGSVVATQ